MERDLIIDFLRNNEKTKPVSRLGYCRVWTKEAILAITRQFPDAEIEAREVDISPNLQHTFLRVVMPNVKPLILDGTGVGKEKPYFGYEEKAPLHLQNSHPDMINNFIKKKVDEK
jgi:hypothetical protein